MSSHRPAVLDPATHRRQGTQRASFDACLSALRRHPPNPSADIRPAPVPATFNGSKASSRRSFALLTNFSDFATLIRSTGRKSSRLQQADITTTEFFSESAGQPVLEPTGRPSTATMHSARHQQKPESRLYSFLTRSRSRSRSKHHPTDDGPPVTVPGSKPPTRIPSRPLSSTTTATNTTITPKPRKQRTPPPDPHPSSSAASSTRPSGARQKLHDLFGIPLRKASRSRSRSRPSSPVGHPVRASLDVPPLPSAGMHDDDSTPRPRKSYTPQMSRPRSPSPSLTQKVLRVTNATENSTGSTAASIKISKFFTKGSTHEPQRPSTAPSVGPPILPPIPSIVSAPLRHTSSLHRRSLIPDQPSQTSLHAPTPPPKITHTPPTPLKGSTGASNGTVSASTSGSGSSKNTTNTTSTGNTSTTQPPLSAPRTGFGHAAKGSLDSNYRYRGGAPMSVLNEEGPSASPAPPRAASSAQGHSSSHKGKSREQAGVAPAEVGQPVIGSGSGAVPRPGGVKMSSSVRSTKHGSFDFERPGGWNGIIGIQRSGSGGTTGTSASGVSRRSGVETREGGGKERERESVYGPGLAGVGTLQREMSMKRAQEREEMVRAKERARRGGASAEKDRARAKEKDREKDRTRTSTSQRTTPDTVHASTSTGASGLPNGRSSTNGHTANGNGKSSSMGRAAGRRAVATLLPKRLTAQHGPFAFEPAVPSPTRSTGTASTCTAHEVAVPLSLERAERERARVREEKERAAAAMRSGVGNGGAGGVVGGKRRSGQVAVPVPSVVGTGGVPPTYSSIHPAPTPSIPDSPIPVSIVPRTLSAMLETSPPPPPAARGAFGFGASKIGSNTKAAPLPPRPSAGHRSGQKGRSLDLGLGLAWAPSKVREEALLPKSAFFARSASNGSAAGSKMGRTASGASGTSGVGVGGGVGRSASVRVGGGGVSARGTKAAPGGVEEEMSEWDAERARLGREVAEEFRSVLDKEGYRLFKSCVHQFDAHEIPLDGSTGIIARIETLLVSAPQLGEEGKRRLVDKFMRIILQVA